MANQITRKNDTLNISVANNDQKQETVTDLEKKNKPHDNYVKYAYQNHN